jgi:UDP-N-acetylmuramyl pentapeptide phosphotransferase/UDP-N-acetylglucosamine-1-phosphate transferase
MMWPVFLSFIAAVAVSWMVRHAGILDHPNARSSHSRPTPRGGGLGVLAGLGGGLLITALIAPVSGLQPTLIAALGFSLLGLADDLLALGSRLKFAIMAVLGAGLVVLTGPVESLGITNEIAIGLPWVIGLAGSVLWVFVVVNAVNFMDGSDGLIVWSAIPAALGLYFLGEGAVSVTGLMLAAGLAGFAVFNVPKASLFLGDVGSLAIGGVLAIASLQAISSAGDIWLYPLLILPLLADVLLTLVHKLRHRIGFLSPHRTHAYQLLVRMGVAHWKVAMGYGAVALFCLVLALVTAHLPAGAPFAAFAGMVAVITLVHTLIRRRARLAGLDMSQ